MTSRENDLLPSSLFPIQYFKNKSCSSAFRPALSNLWLLLVIIIIVTITIITIIIIIIIIIISIINIIIIIIIFIIISPDQK